MTPVQHEQERFRLVKQAEIALLEARLLKAEAEAHTLRRALVVARAQLLSIPTSSREVEDQDRKYPGLGSKSIVDRIRDHYRAHPDLSFSPAEVMTVVGIPIGNIEAVRKAYLKLYREGTLDRLGHAEYRLADAPKDHPTQSNPRNC